jgi:hypothetical protein
MKSCFELCLFVPTKTLPIPRKLLKKLGVPINDLFEHLTATIAEATPLYELCASVLE